MKRSCLTAIIAALIYATAAGQALTLSSDSISVTGYSDTALVARGFIYNNLPDSADVKWHRFYEDIPENWDGTAVCDGEQCYLIPVSSSVFRMAPNSYDNFQVHFYPNDFPGTGIVRLRAWVVGDSASTVIEGTFKGTSILRQVGVKSPEENEKIRIYPNPARDYIFIRNLPQRETSTIEVYNIFGRRMLSFSQAPNNSETVQRFDINVLAKGIYMIRIFDAAMNVIYTESLSKE